MAHVALISDWWSQSIALVALMVIIGGALHVAKGAPRSSPGRAYKPEANLAGSAYLRMPEIIAM